MELISPAVTGYDQYRENIPRGVMETVEYPSTTVGNSRKAMVYTPPEFSSTKMYPVLFLLHGIGGDETEWHTHGSPQIILDNLYNDNLLEPMVIVFLTVALCRMTEPKETCLNLRKSKHLNGLNPICSTI